VTGDGERDATLSGYAPAEASQLKWEIGASLAGGGGKSRKDLPRLDIVWGVFFLVLVPLALIIVVEFVVFLGVFIRFVVE